jgi:hypothetical protein
MQFQQLRRFYKQSKSFRSKQRFDKRQRPDKHQQQSNYCRLYFDEQFRLCLPQETLSRSKQRKLKGL